MYSTLVGIRNIHIVLQLTRPIFFYFFFLESGFCSGGAKLENILWCAVLNQTGWMASSGRADRALHHPQTDTLTHGRSLPAAWLSAEVAGVVLFPFADISTARLICPFPLGGKAAVMAAQLSLNKKKNTTNTQEPSK